MALVDVRGGDRELLDRHEGVDDGDLEHAARHAAEVRATFITSARRILSAALPVRGAVFGPAHATDARVMTAATRHSASFTVRSGSAGTVGAAFR